MVRAYVLVLSLMVCSTLLPAQPPAPLWTHTYGGSGQDRAFALCNDPADGVMVTGFGQRPGQGVTGPWTLRLSTEGDSVSSFWWPSQIQDSGGYSGRCILPLPDGGFALAGNCQWWMRPIFLTKLTATGDTSWTGFYFSSGMELRGMTLASDGGFVLTGTWFSTSSPEMYVFRISPTGNLDWTHMFGNSGTDSGLAVISLPDDGFAVCGSMQDSLMGTTRHGYLVRLNSDGDSLWTRSYGGSTYNSFVALNRTSDNGFILGGVSDTLSDPGAEHIYLVRTDSDGTPLWQKHLWLQGQDHTCGISDIKQMPDGGFLAVGWTHLASAWWPYDAFIIKFNANGDTLWTLIYGGANQYQDRLKSIVLAPGGGFYAAGYWGSEQGLADNFYVLRFPPESGVRGVVSSPSGLPIPGVRVSVLGQTVSTLTDTLGRYSFTIPPGSYDLAISHPCLARDTARSIVVSVDSIAVHDWTALFPNIQYSPSSITMQVYNHRPDTTHLTVYNVGEGVLDVSVAAVPESPASPWLTAWPLSGAIAAGDSLTLAIRVAADSNGTGFYEYSGFIRVHTNTCPDSSTEVYVNVMVRPNAVTPAGETVPAHFDLSVYPNPFNPVTTLSLALPQQTRLTLVLYDLQGRRVRTLRDGVMDAGVHRITVDGSALPSGLYFATLQTPAFSRTQKLMLVK